MSYNKDLNGHTGGLEREDRRRARQKKWEERSKHFWRTFLFTENGKPKSGFLIYTFCLSAVFIALHLIAYTYIVDWLALLTESWPLVLGNLTGSLCVSAAVLLVGYVLHRLLSDKRLMLGTYLWLLLYLVASVITMALLLGNDARVPALCAVVRGDPGGPGAGAVHAALSAGSSCARAGGGRARVEKICPPQLIAADVREDDP